jgi:tetratricopeptide (TPR) repeat protein
MEGVADQMRSHSEKIIEIDPDYENGAGYFMLGAVHYKSPYIPFLLSWPNNAAAIKWLEMSYNTGEAKLAQGVYLSQALYKAGRYDEAIKLCLSSVIRHLQPLYCSSIIRP